MATTVPQRIRDAFATAKLGTQPLTFTDDEGYQWLAMSPQTYGGGDQGPTTIDGVYMGGGGPISGYRRSDTLGAHPGEIGTSALFYDPSGQYTHTSQNDAVGIMGNPLFGAALIGGAAFGLPALANAAGFGGTGAAAAGTAGTAGAAGTAGGASLGGGFGPSLTGGIGTTVPAGAGFGTVGGSLGGSLAGTYGAGALGLDAALAGVGAAGAAGAGLGSGLGSAAAAGGAGAGGAGGAGAGASGGFNWGSLVGPALSVVGGLAGADAAKDAANAQLTAAREAQAKLEPWYQAGGNALNRLQELLGIGGNKGAADYGSAARDFGASDFQADPGYAFRQQEGEKALTRAASAAGGIGSGKYLKDAMAWNQGQASQEYNNSFNRFYTARQNKLSPFQSLAGQGQTTAQTMGDLSTQAGNAVAAGKVGRANALTNAIGQGWSMYQNSQQQDQNNALMNMLLNRGSY